MEEASFEPGTLTGELLILATAANQLFQSTQDMSPDAQVRRHGCARALPQDEQAHWQSVVTACIFMLLRSMQQPVVIPPLQQLNKWPC